MRAKRSAAGLWPALDCVSVLSSFLSTLALPPRISSLWWFARPLSFSYTHIHTYHRPTTCPNSTKHKNREHVQTDATAAGGGAKVFERLYNKLHDKQDYYRH